MPTTFTQGRLVIKTTADPAAGAQVSWTADEDVIIHALSFSLTTDANVANRQVRLEAKDSANNIFFRTIGQQIIAASVAGAVITGFEGETEAAPGSNWVLLPLPSGGLRLKTGDVLYTSLNNGQVGDDFTPIVMQCERISLTNS